MQVRQLKIRWLILSAAILVLFSGAFAAYVSSSPAIASLTLTEGHAVDISVFRFSPDTARIRLEFDCAPYQRRPELGEYAATTGSDYLEFRYPGQQVLVKVQSTESTVEYEAMPASGYGAGHIRRNLVVRKNDGNENRFAWPPNHATLAVLPRGLSSITLTVVAIGPALAGETVRIVIEPPLSFKSAMPGYGFLWWFFFWPIPGYPLACYGVYLAWQTWKLRAR